MRSFVSKIILAATIFAAPVASNACYKMVGDDCWEFSDHGHTDGKVDFSRCTSTRYRYFRLFGSGCGATCWEVSQSGERIQQVDRSHCSHHTKPTWY